MVKIKYDERYAVKATNDIIVNYNEFLMSKESCDLIKFGYMKGYYDAIDEMSNEEREKIYYH